MQKAEIILSILEEKSSKDKNYVFKRLFRILFNDELYYCLSRDLKNTLEKKDVVKIVENLKKENLKEIFSNPNHAKIVCHNTIKILNALYEPLCMGSFNEKEEEDFKSFGNRFLFMKKNFRNKKYFIDVSIDEVDLKNIDEALIKILADKIQDGRFLELVRQIMKHIRKENNANILRLKRVLNHVIMNFICQKIRSSTNLNKKDHYCICNERLIIALNTNKNKAVEIQEKLKLELSTLLEATKIKQSVKLKDIGKNKLMFVGFEITKSKDEKIFYLIPQRTVNEALKPFFKNSKVVHCNNWINLSVDRIIANYRAKTKSIENYYKGADNFNKRMKRFRFYIHLSLLKTIARKEKISIKKVLQRYGKDLLDSA